MSSRFTGQVALVTGGAAGIGLATARRLCQDGAAVAIVDINQEGLARAADELRQGGGRVHAAVADVGQPGEVEAAIHTTTAALGPIDILVNNVGVSILKTYLQHSDDDFQRQVTLNLTGTHYFMSRILPGMVERRRGAVINISSVAALHYTVPHVVYAATKAAVIALSRDVAFEVAPHGVRVNCVAPGLIAVEAVIANLGQSPEALDQPTTFRPMGWGRPDDVAAVVAFLASDEARFVTGVTIPVAGGTDLLVSMASNEVEKLMNEGGVSDPGAPPRDLQPAPL